MALRTYLIEIIRKFLPARLQNHQNQTIRRSARRECRRSLLRAWAKDPVYFAYPRAANTWSAQSADQSAGFPPRFFWLRGHLLLNCGRAQFSRLVAKFPFAPACPDRETAFELAKCRDRPSSAKNVAHFKSTNDQGTANHPSTLPY